ncbi:unannotated protein [freshwater metagenome]|uniref:Unannotated protein n=1 Tax=freshwater metagenome TaxID=449393 RepID=A0A6J7CP58_9ZZZZ|nr:hypothetical protein [Actinomycetota bacterium]MUH52895.1 hypothetical protein [Actinomycetota bacterium]
MRKFVLILAVLMLTGCATIPTAGPVVVAGPNTVGSQTDVEFLPAGPAEGATQREILDGFINAGSAPQNNFRIARSFLTDEAALVWNPAGETMVRGVYDSVMVTAATEMTYSAGIVSVVDGAGVLTNVEPAQTREWSFSFARVNGEWRLSGVPDVTVISESTFSSTYGEYTAYFVNHNQTALVPDVRVFARQGDPMFSVARAVIAGPSPYLPNTSTAFPQGTELVSVLVDDKKGIATVDVSDNVRQAPTTDQRIMLAQLRASLGEFTNVTATAMSINQSLLAIAGVPGLETAVQVDDRPLILYNKSFGYSHNSKIESVPSNAASIVSLEPTSISFDASTNAAAVSSPTGVYLVTDGTEQISVKESSVEPQIDGSGTVWWVENHLPDLISVFADGREFLVDGPWRGSAHIVGLEVSRDDARVAIAINDLGHAYVLVGAITVDATGLPTAVNAYRRLSVSADLIVDIAWADSNHVAVLGSRSGVVHAEVATVGGGSRLIGQPQNPTGISGGNKGVSGLVVISGNGQLWKPRGVGWQATGVFADILATQH